MRLLVNLFLFVGLLMAIPIAAQAVIAPGGVTPEKVIGAFDAWAMVIMTVLGFVITRAPALKAIPKDLVPWINALAYIVGKVASWYAVPEAHAGALGAVGHTLSIPATVAWGAFLSSLTSVLYDKLLKFPLDRTVPKTR
jgi:hypothetical protein